jgi:uncharacterized protein with ATP-grasp and redox domains
MIQTNPPGNIRSWGEGLLFMKVQNACLECVIRQTRNTLDQRKTEDSLTAPVLEEVKNQLIQIDWEQTPADLSNIAYRTIEKYFPGDPFEGAKREQNMLAMSYYPTLKEIVATSENKLLAAVRIAATGNVIDLGIGMKVDIQREVDRVMHTPLPVDDTEILRQKLASPITILYIADNAGEIVFDRIFIEELLREGHRVTVVVRGGPVINDATLEDAESVGLMDLLPVITTGTNRLGIPWRHVGEEFLSHYQMADLLISKGQANYETVSERFEKETFYILRAKCEVISQQLGVNHLDLIVKYQAPR